MKVSYEKMQQYVDRINSQIPVAALFDGYRIRMFKHKNLVIGGSRDWIYYHNIDIIFKKVSFFNIPDFWSDWRVVGDTLFRLTTIDEFQKHHPDFKVVDRHVFAIDLNWSEEQTHTYFIVAKNVFFEKLDPVGNGKFTTLFKRSVYDKSNKVFDKPKDWIEF